MQQMGWQTHSKAIFLGPAELAPTLTSAFCPDDSESDRLLSALMQPEFGADTEATGRFDTAHTALHAQS